jgi:hypothetical protein
MGTRRCQGIRSGGAKRLRRFHEASSWPPSCAALPMRSDVPALLVCARCESLRTVDAIRVCCQHSSRSQCRGPRRHAQRFKPAKHEGPQAYLCFAKTYGGLVGEYKLDWFFVKGFATDSRKPRGKYQFAPHFAWTLMELNNAPDDPLSDHAPITVDIPLTEPPPP